MDESTAPKKVPIWSWAALAVPLDVPLTLLLYNPFGPATMARLCERLAQTKADIRIYYAYPAHGDVVARLLAPPADRLRRLGDIAYFHLPAGPKIAPFPT